MTLEPQETSPETSLFEQDCTTSPRTLKSYIFVRWDVVSHSYSSGPSHFPVTLTPA